MLCHGAKYNPAKARRGSCGHPAATKRLTVSSYIFFIFSGGVRKSWPPM
jgi:hypothetical protein